MVRSLDAAEATGGLVVRPAMSISTPTNLSIGLVSTYLVVGLVHAVVKARHVALGTYPNISIMNTPTMLLVYSREVSPSTPPTLDPTQSAAPFRPPLLEHQLCSRTLLGRIGVPDIAGHIFDVSDAVVNASLCITADVAIPSTK